MMNGERCEELRKRLEDSGDSRINTDCRFCSITPEMVGKKIGVHNGKKYTTVYITREMIGFKLGDFSLTKKEVIHHFTGTMRKK